jgi:hypothetical protein
MRQTIMQEESFSHHLVKAYFVLKLSVKKVIRVGIFLLISLEKRKTKSDGS